MNSSPVNNIFFKNRKRKEENFLEDLPQPILLSVSSSYKAFMMERKSDGKIGIRLYLKIISKQFCLNEELVNKGYATFSSESEEADEGKRKLTNIGLYSKK